MSTVEVQGKVTRSIEQINDNVRMLSDVRNYLIKQANGPLCIYFGEVNKKLLDDPSISICPIDELGPTLELMNKGVKYGGSFLVTISDFQLTEKHAYQKVADMALCKQDDSGFIFISKARNIPPSIMATAISVDYLPTYIMDYHNSYIA